MFAFSENSRPPPPRPTYPSFDHPLSQPPYPPQLRSPVVNELDERHMSHQHHLRNLINETQNPQNPSFNPHHPNYNQNINRNPDIPYLSTPLVQPYHKRNLSEARTGQMENLKYSNYRPQVFSTAQKKYHDDHQNMTSGKKNQNNFSMIGKVSEFDVSDFLNPKKRDYDSIIAPQYSQARSMSFQERRRNFKVKDQRRENDAMNNQAYIKKLHDSFVFEFDKNQRKIQSPTTNPPPFQYFNEAYSNIQSFQDAQDAMKANFMMQNQMPPPVYGANLGMQNQTPPPTYGPNFGPNMKDDIQMNFMRSNQIPPPTLGKNMGDTIINPHINDENNLQQNFRNSQFLNQNTPFPFFTGKDSNLINSKGSSPMQTNYPPKTQKVNLAGLPLLVQDFVILMEYDREIDKAKKLLKENGNLKLSVLYKIMKKNQNSMIEPQDFALLIQNLKLDFGEQSINELFKRFSKNDGLKLKYTLLNFH